MLFWRSDLPHTLFRFVFMLFCLDLQHCTTPSQICVHTILNVLTCDSSHPLSNWCSCYSECLDFWHCPTPSPPSFQICFHAILNLTCGINQIRVYDNLNLTCDIVQPIVFMLILNVWLAALLNPFSDLCFMLFWISLVTLSHPFSDLCSCYSDCNTCQSSMEMLPF